MFIQKSVHDVMRLTHNYQEPETAQLSSCPMDKPACPMHDRKLTLKRIQLLTHKNRNDSQMCLATSATKGAYFLIPFIQYSLKSQTTGTGSKSAVARAGREEGFATGGLHREFGVTGPFCTIAAVGDSRLHVSNPQRVNCAACELKDTSEAMG